MDLTQNSLLSANTSMVTFMAAIQTQPSIVILHTTMSLLNAGTTLNRDTSNVSTAKHSTAPDYL